MTPSHTEHPHHAQNGSGLSSTDTSVPAPTSQMPPVDEVCRILARILNRLQADQPAVGDAA